MRLFIVVSYLLLVSGIAFAQTPVPPEVASFDGWFSYLVDKIHNVTGFGAILAGLATGFIVPQFVKMNLPIEWDDGHRRRYTRRLAFFCGFVPTFLIWPVTLNWLLLTAQQWYTLMVSGILVAVLVGCATPFTYTVIMKRLYRWGWVDESRWSGEVRAADKRDAMNQPAPQAQKDRTDTQ